MTSRAFRIISTIACLILLKYLSLSFDSYPAFLKDPQKLEFLKKLTVMIFQMIPFILILGMMNEYSIQRLVRYRYRIVYWYVHVASIVVFFSLFVLLSFLISQLGGEFGKVYFGNLALLPWFLVVELTEGVGISLGFIAVLLSLDLYIKMGAFSFLSLQLRGVSGILPSLFMTLGILLLFYLLYRKEMLDDRS